MPLVHLSYYRQHLHHDSLQPQHVFYGSAFSAKYSYAARYIKQVPVLITARL